MDRAIHLPPTLGYAPRRLEERAFSPDLVKMNSYYSHPVMNNTKWEEIREAMCNTPTHFQWRTKDIETGYISMWDVEWYYHFRLGDYKYIEWLEIKADTEELRKDLLDILEKVHVPGKILEDAIRVYGYAGTGSYVDYI